MRAADYQHVMSLERPAVGRAPSRAWYALTAIPGIVAVAIAVWLVIGMIEDVERMPRVVIPCTHELSLAAGHHVIYGETASMVDGVAYVATSFSVRCSLTAPDHTALALERPTGSTHYSIGDYSGQSLFAVDVPRTATYRLACESPDARSVLAIGSGGFATVVVALILVVVLALSATGIIGWLVHRARRRHRVVRR